MDTAIIMYSRAGFCTERIEANDLKSHEDARKYWPLLSDDGTKLVTWVKSTDLPNGRWRKKHFRKLPSFYQRTNLVRVFDLLEEKRQKRTAESPEHAKAKDLICQELRRRIEAGDSQKWVFRDRLASDFHFKGDLLFGATAVDTELRVETVFGSSFKLDIGIIGPTLKKHSAIIGGIEIEYRNQIEGRKALMMSSLGFPLISIDISGMLLSEIDELWAQKVLSKTTVNSEKGFRKNYIYLPTALYPLYINVPESLYKTKDTRHQYLAFAKFETLKKIETWLSLLRDVLGYATSDIDLTILNASSETARTQLENAGSIVGADWKEYSSSHCLRVSLFRPAHDKNRLLSNHLFHMTMARLFAEQDVLVGYKYALGGQHLDPNAHIWILNEWNKDLRINTPHRLLPKRLAHPILPVLKKVESIKRQM